ncbi:MAG: formylglycine-generating enzyme family protein [Planctomycetes bacterium]|nr:formylglycine-generating enzyme family protein [Planctomycetota bacterium]
MPPTHPSPRCRPQRWPTVVAGLALFASGCGGESTPAPTPPQPARAAAVADALQRAGLAPAAGSATDAATGYPQRVVHQQTGAVLTLLPAGEFTMGSPANEAARRDDEVAHRRVIRQPYYLGVTEVTQAQWRKVMGNNPSQFPGDDLPVEHVSWDDCQQFVQKAVGGLRLPSEAEWEYACRAGTTTPFAFGATITPAQANFDGNEPYGGASKGPNRAATVAAGSLLANAWGLHEMHGNVWEHCQDGYEAYSGTGTDAPSRAAGARVLRGGGWNDSASSCRAAYRNRYEPGSRDDDGMGLRVARTLPE